MDEFNNNFQNTQEYQNTVEQPDVEPKAAEANLKTDGTYEQRPSQKYGRTAYQQQVNAQNQNTRYEQPYNSNPYVQPNQQYGGSQYNQPDGNGQYQQYNQAYGNGQYQQYNQAYGNAQYQKPHGPVSNLYSYILMILVGLTIAINLFSYQMIFGIVGSVVSDDYIQMYSEIMALLENNPIYTVLGILSQFIMIATIVLFVLDIVKIYRENYKITGLILFAIFLRPAYFIWRAHVLGQKKVIPVIYTIAAYGISFFASFYMCYQMVLNMMSAIM